MEVLISGAGIAGPTLAFWLARYGFSPTLVETAPAPRTGGYIIDFWGAGYDVADEMGLIPELSAKGYMLNELRLVNANGEHVGGFDARVFARATKGRYLSLPSSALAESLYRRLPKTVEMLFGDEVTAVDADDGGYRVSFARAAPRAFDAVIGAGGLHSRVRKLCFGEERQFSDYLGYKAAAFEVKEYQPRDELTYVSYAAPGKQAARFALRDGGTLFLLAMADSSDELPRDDASQRAYLHNQFDDAGWECAAIMTAMDSCGALYLDNVSQIHVPRWSKDAVALVGDAAACPSLLASEGASLAMAGAYVLAGELKRVRGDHVTAFARYEALMRPFVERKQRAARGFASAFAPRTRFGITVRNLVTRAMGIPLVANLALGNSVRDDFTLPVYS